MSRFSVLLKDLAADKGRFGAVRKILTAEQWSEVLAADARGVSARAIFAALSGNVQPFFTDPKQFKNALYAERLARRKQASKVGGGLHEPV